MEIKLKLRLPILAKGFLKSTWIRCLIVFIQWRMDPNLHKTAAGWDLSIARGLVHAHQGKIKIASKAGLGTTVTISLPLKTKTVKKIIRG